MPYTTSSEDMLCAELGNFKMTNAFERKKHLSSQMDSYNINILSMTLSNTNFKTVRNKRSYPILQDLFIDVGLELPVSTAAYESFPQMKVFTVNLRVSLILLIHYTRS